MSLDVESAYHAFSRQLLFDAVEATLLLLLPNWADGAPKDLHIFGAAKGTTPMKSQAGVRQTEALSKVCAALAFQSVLERVAATAPNAYAVVVAIANETTSAWWAASLLHVALPAFSSGNVGRATLRY